MRNEIVVNMTDEEYFAHEGLSKHRLDDFAKAPAYFKFREGAEFKPSRNMELGTQVHLLALKGIKGYAVLPECDRRTKAGKEIYAEFCEQNQGLLAVTEQEARDIEGATEAIAPILAPRMNGYEGFNSEVAMFWERDGEQCKGKADLVWKDVETNKMMISDIKTTSDIIGFDRSFFHFRYHIQAAWYADGFKRLRPSRDVGFEFIVVEMTAPYLHQVVIPTEAVTGSANETIRREFEYYLDCKKRNNWPGLPPVRYV